MWHRTLRALTTRTHGYVFWRDEVLQELSKTRRSYLCTERPVALAEVVRRMVRVRARYEGARDEHERTLLRGEYKYFSGKLCSLAGARVSDMIALLQCGAFFGFADTSQLDTVCAQLLRRLDELAPHELCCLFVCLPGLHRQGHALYARVAEELVDAVPSLTVDECMRVCAACSASPPRGSDDDDDDDNSNNNTARAAAAAADAAATVPAALQHNLLARIELDVSHLTPRQVIDTIDYIAAAPAAVQRCFGDLLDTLAARAAALVDTLAPLDVAVVYDALTAHRRCSSTLARRLLARFVQCAASTCARSTATMFATALRASFASALWLAAALAQRVVFLTTDFTLPELLAVYRVYVACLTSMCAVVDAHDADVGGEDSSRDTTAATATTATTTAAASAAAAAVAAAAIARTEAAAARRQQASLRHVLDELGAQLRVLLDDPVAYVTLEHLLELLDVYASAVDELAAAAAATASSSTPSQCSATAASDAAPRHTHVGHDEADARAARATCEAATRLLRDVGDARAILRALSGKVIAALRTAPLSVLVRVLQLVHTLGPHAVDDALAAAAVHELVVRDYDRSRLHGKSGSDGDGDRRLNVDAATTMADALESLTNLRAEHQRRLHSIVVPRLRGASAAC